MRLALVRPGSLLAATLTTLTLALAGCGGDDDASTDATSAGTAGSSQSGGSSQAGGASGSTSGGSSQSAGAGGGEAGAGGASDGGSAGSSQSAGAGGDGSGQGGEGGAPSQAGNKLAWIKTFGAKGEDVAAGVSVDAAGNVYLTGYYELTVSFGGDDLTAVGAQDAAVVKLDPQGNHVFSKSYGDMGIDAVAGAVADADGNVFLCGIFSTKITLGDQTIDSKGDSDVFVVRLDPSGNFVWGKTFGGAKTDVGRSIGLTPSGQIAIAGLVEGDVDLGSGMVTTKGSDAFVLLLDKDGNHVASVIAGGDGDDLAQSLAVGPEGDIWISGSYRPGFDLGTGPLTAADGEKNNSYVARLGPDLKAKWVSAFAGPDEDVASAVAVDASGNALFAVTYQGATIDLGKGPMMSKGFYELAYGMLDPDGKTLWAQTHGSSIADGAFGVAFDGAGNGYLSGIYSDSVDFGTGEVEASGFLSNFLLKLDATGATTWVKDLGPSSINNYALFNAVTVDPSSGAPVVVGHFDGSHDFGAGEIENKGKGDIFVIKYEP